MNPEDLMARQAMMQQLTGGGGEPQPHPGQVTPDPAGIPPQNGGQPGRKPNPTEALIKQMMVATSPEYDPEVQEMSKALIAKLIPYLG